MTKVLKPVRDREAVHDDLAAIGFSDHEARIYVALALQPDSATAYELAKATQIPVPNTYNVIRGLTARGATRQVSRTPARYVAVPPAELFGQFATDTNRRCEALVSRFATLRPEQNEDYVEMFAGSNEVERRVLALIENCRHRLILKCRSDLPPAWRAALAAALGRGVQCLFIYYGAAPALPMANLRAWPHEGNGAEMGGDFFTFCADSKAALTYDMNSYEGASSANRRFVYLADVLLRHELYLAELMLHFGPDIEAKFGPMLYRLRTEYGMLPLNDAMRTYVRAQSAGIPDFDLPTSPARMRNPRRKA